MEIRNMYLCGNVSKGSWCSACHVVQTSISRAGGFGLLVYWARGCKHVFKSLDGSSIRCINLSSKDHLPLRECHPVRGPSKDHRNYICSRHKEK
jgi:hypothetical protein